MEADKEKKWPGFTGETYPEVFTKVPVSDFPRHEKKPGQLSEEQLNQFFEDGYLLIDSLFTEEELQPAIEDIQGLVEVIGQRLYQGGKIKQLYSDYDFNTRLTMMEKEFPGANVLLHKYGRLTPGMQKVWTDDRLLNMMEQLLGTQNITGHPVWNLRTKTPQTDTATVPWHQDAGYLGTDSYGVMQMTAWIPLVDTDEVNGCLQMVRGGHKRGLVANHTCAWRDTWYIMLAEDEMERTLGVNMDRDTVTLPVKKGGILLFSNLIPHRSLPNNSQSIRWSLDLRWQRGDKPNGFPMEGIQMRSSDPSFKIDWDPFTKNIRNDETVACMNQEQQDLFDTVIMGPWLKKWEVTNMNRHVQRAYQQEGEQMVAKA